LFTISLIISDILLTGLAFRLAYLIRFNLDLPIFRLEVVPSFPFYQDISLLLIPLWFTVFALNGVYQRNNLLGGISEYSRIFRAVNVGTLLIIVAGFLNPDFVLARGWLLLAWVLAFLLVVSGRFGLRRLVYHLRRHGYFLAPALIIGANKEGYSLAEQLLSWRTSGLHVLGFVDDRIEPGKHVHRHLQALGATSQLETLIQQHGIEELILTTSALSRDEVVTIFKQYGLVRNLNLRLSSGLFEVITTGLEIKEIAYVPVVRVNQVRLRGLDNVLKMLLDYSIALPSLVCTLPLFILIAVAIRLDSPGPIIYRRRVMGINGKQFDAYKFRTMHVNGDEILAGQPELQTELAQNHKLKDDPRVTRIGNLLRKLSLDELPQLLNVLKREMSLVGPRIISPAEMEKYDHWGMNLLTIPPGITGLWQVSGRSDISYEERVRLDMHYIRNWNIWLDLQLLIQTIPAVLFRRGAY
jgi:exopolysaccharide biosynthesis polyprenyl glycosylphosphotransferase